MDKRAPMPADTDVHANDDTADGARSDAPPLSPLRVRLTALAVMVFVAVLSIWLIDARAMRRQAQLQQSSAPAAPTMPHHTADANDADAEPQP